MAGSCEAWHTNCAPCGPRAFTWQVCQPASQTNHPLAVDQKSGCTDGNVLLCALIYIHIYIMSTLFWLYPKGVYLPVSKRYSILAVANLLAHILVYEFGTAKIKCTIALQWTRNIWRGTTYFAADGKFELKYIKWKGAKKRRRIWCSSWLKWRYIFGNDI